MTDSIRISFTQTGLYLQQIKSKKMTPIMDSINYLQYSRKNQSFTQLARCFFKHAAQKERYNNQPYINTSINH